LRLPTEAAATWAPRVDVFEREGRLVTTVDLPGMKKEDVSVQEGRLVGVVTDRDLYIELATRNRCAAALVVADVAQSPVYTCSPEDDGRRGVGDNADPPGAACSCRRVRRHGAWRDFSRRPRARRRAGRGDSKADRRHPVAGT
jgi:hypothetical protein